MDLELVVFHPVLSPCRLDSSIVSES